MDEEKTYHLFRLKIYERYSHDLWTNWLVEDDVQVVGTDLVSVYNSITSSFDNSLRFIGSIEILKTNISIFYVKEEQNE